jgi:hypothetical protein
MNPSENFYFTKRSLTGLMSGSWTQRDEIALAEGFWGLVSLNNTHEFSSYHNENTSPHYND